MPEDSGVPEGWGLEVRYKPIRNIWFRVDARNQCFRISAPAGIHPNALKRAIRAKHGWMASRAAVQVCPLLIPDRLDDGQTCLVRGKSYSVSVTGQASGNSVNFTPDTGLDLCVRSGTDPGACACLLSGWYRQTLAREIPRLLEIWQPELGVRVSEFRIRKMKTRWGSCNTRAKRIWINLALACLSFDLLEYVLVHELIHLLEPSHNKRFYRLMGRFLPDWPDRKSRLASHAPGLG